MNWRLKLLTQAALAGVPGGETVYGLLRRRCGKLRSPDWRDYIDALRSIMEATGKAGSFDGMRTVEIGTGWTPGVPLLLHAFGAGETHTYDKNRFGDAALTREMLSRLPAMLAREFPGGTDAQSRIRELAKATEGLSFEETLRRFDVIYHAPADASRTGLPDASVHLVYSHSVLQYIPPAMLRSIFTECRRILGPGGMMWHRVDFSDGFSHDDPGITSNHFLLYEDWQWNLMAGNRYSYHSRVRPSRFLAILDEFGFDARIALPLYDERALAFARGTRLASGFRECDDGDLCAVSGDIVATARIPGGVPPLS